MTDKGYNTGQPTSLDDEVHNTPGQNSISCGTAGPAVIDSEQPSSIIKGANIGSFVAKSVLSRFTRFLVVTAQTKHCQIGQLHD